MKHIMCPVNYNTGKVELSIPIYEIRTRDFTLPLRLQYDSGGIKVSAGNGVAGLGWNVDFGPTVTRSIQGNPDEEGYLIYNPDFGSWDTSYMHKMTEGMAHEQPDVFFIVHLMLRGISCSGVRRNPRKAARIYRFIYR